MTKITINPELCAKCGACVRICPEAILTQATPEALPATVREHLCISCGHCVAICPHDALSHSDYPEGTVGPIDTPSMPSPDQVLELLRARRSIRSFRDKVVERQVVQEIIDAAQWAPAAHNIRDLDVIVVRDKTVLRKIAETTARHWGSVAKQLRNPLARSLARVTMPGAVQSAGQFVEGFELIASAAQEGRDLVLYKAPCLIVFHSGPSITFPEANANLALHNATMMAQALGLGTFWAGWVVGACKREKEITKLLGVPAGHTVHAAMTLGYPKVTFTKWVARKPGDIVWR